MKTKIIIAAVTAALAFAAFDAPAFAHHKNSVFSANGGNGGTCILAAFGCNGGKGGTINNAGNAPKGTHASANGGNGGDSLGSVGSSNGGAGGTINF